MSKPRPHDFCSECGSDLGPIPPPPPRCHHCRMTVKGHKGPWGVGRCRNAKPHRIDLDKFFSQTIKAYGEQLGREFFSDRQGPFTRLWAAQMMAGATKPPEGGSK